MTWIIFILLFLSASFGIAVSLFLRIRFDIESLIYEKEQNIDLVKKLMLSVVNHDDMKMYIEEIKKECEELNSAKGKNTKEKWKKYEQAFGGKKEDSD